MRLLLLSNSTNFGRGYLDHAEGKIRAFLSGIGRILFVPFALYDQAAYWSKVRERLAPWGIEVDRCAEGRSGRAALEKSEAVFVGGGNTFRLIDHLQRSGLAEAIRNRVLAGLPYMGASAGTVIASPSIRTTNDMPIVQPASFEALGLVPFQINCHYLDPDPGTKHMGETREVRIREFHEENETAVVGLREGAWLEISLEPGRAGSGISVLLAGTAGARIFRRGADALEAEPGAELGSYLAAK